MGATETLNPLLVGLSNMAINYLPVGYKLGGVVSATREVVQGVRYNILVNAVTDKAEPLVCLIEVLERPWALMQWGEKQRTLIHTNCTAEEYNAAAANEENNFNFNPVFVNKGGEMTDEELKMIEGQIVVPKPRTTKQPDVPDFMKQLVDQIVVNTTPAVPKAVTEPAIVPSVTESDRPKNTKSTRAPITEATPHQEDDIQPLQPLNDASKNILDDFFNVDTIFRTQAQPESIAISNTNVNSNPESISESTTRKAEQRGGEEMKTTVLTAIKSETNSAVHTSIDITAITNDQSKEINGPIEPSTTQQSPQFEGLALVNADSNSPSTPDITTSNTASPDGPSTSSDSNRRKRQATSTEAAYIEDIARRSLLQLDATDSDDHKRVLLDVLRSNRVDTDAGTNFVLALRVANSHCVEDKSTELDLGCAENLVPGTTKICNVEVNRRDIKLLPAH